MLYKLMLVTGLRIGEALRLNAEDAGRAKVEIRVKGWTREGEKRERMKTVYMPKALQEHLTQYLRFKRRKGESLGARGAAVCFAGGDQAELAPGAKRF